MPHIKLEHTENVKSNKIKSVFNQLINILVDNTNAKKENCKCKAIQIPIYAVGDNDSGHFYYLEISLLKGRPEYIRQIIGNKSLQILQDYFNDADENNVKQFSVEIREIITEDYFTTSIL